jgi:hypothetical protein
MKIPPIYAAFRFLVFQNQSVSTSNFMCNVKKSKKMQTLPRAEIIVSRPCEFAAISTTFQVHAQLMYNLFLLLMLVRAIFLWAIFLNIYNCNTQEKCCLVNGNRDEGTCITW